MALPAACVALALAAPRATADVYVVDGACGISGSGRNLGCGGNGPLRTIAEGILALQPGDTLNVRGAHGAFDGIYVESLALADAAGVPGRSLPCTASQPCVIQGCRAGACPTDEVPIIRGMTLRSDWVPLGGGVYRRTMEATPNPDPLARDAYDPTILVQGTAYPLSLLGYSGDSVATPPDGQWSYDPPTQQIYVHPPGGVDAGTTVYVPNFGFNLVVQTPTNYVTLQYLTFEGVRGYSIYFNTITPASPITGMTLSHLIQRYAGRKFIQTTRGTEGTLIQNNLSEYGGRGISFAFSTDDGFFGYRLFGFHDGIVQGNTIRHIGATGQVRLSGGHAWPCSWCDPPWNDPTHTYISTSGTAYQVKQTDTATIEDNLAQDVSTEGLSLDVSRHVTVHRNTVHRASTGLGMLNFTPTAGCPTTALTEYCYNSDHVISANMLDDVGYADQVGCGMYIIAGSERTVGGTMLAQIYNNVISHIGWGGICVNNEGGTPTADLSIWNNTFFGARTESGVRPGSGIIIGDATHNVVVEDNAFDALESDALNVSTAAAQGLTMDGDVIGTVSGCQVRWGNGSCDTLAEHETHGRTGALRFVDPTAGPPDLHLGAGSVAIDAGVPDGITVDLEDHPRPQGTGWDAGAYEFGPLGPRTTTTLPGALARCLGGTMLMLQDRPRRLLVSSHDASQLVVGNGADVPAVVAAGGSLHVEALGGDGFDQTYPLPASGWHLLRPKRPSHGVRYRDRNGPITTVVLKASQSLIVRGSGPQLEQSLASNPATVEVELDLGEYRYRLEFGGVPRFKVNKRLVRRHAARPLTCSRVD
jgi:hypothetical protein